MEQSRTILIVDDEAVGRETLEALLFGQGYTLAFAANGQEALAQALALKPDVILLDVMMPGLDGFEVCRRIRADASLAEVPVIMVTALDDRDSRLEGIEAGADDFVSKPFDRMELRARINTITRLNRYRRLHLERTKFDWVVDQADNGYVVVNGKDEILYANRQARTYFGLSSEKNEPQPEKFLAIAQARYRYEPEERWHDWPNQPDDGAPRYLVQAASPTMNTFWLQVDVMPMTPNAEFLVRLRDVTESVVERRSIWAFHAQVSHKLKTPLTVLDGFIEMLTENDDYFTEADRKKFLASARKNSLLLRKNVLDIFEYMQAKDVIRAGRDTCRVAEIPAIVNKICHDMKINSVDISLDGLASPGLDTIIPLSSQAVELIFWELLENSQKFHPNQTPTLAIKIFSQGNRTKIQLVDDGQSLSAEQLTKMWTPYYQAEKIHSGQIPGMGLGLAMVASLVWSIGGSCRSNNREDEAGLVIELELPRVNYEK
jgi:DNA-binding response OmpR family regulator